MTTLISWPYKMQRNAYYVIKCSKCDNKRYTPNYSHQSTHSSHPHICPECNATTELKLACHRYNCFKIVNDLESTVCTNCLNALHPTVELEDVIFSIRDSGNKIGGCNNFNTNKQNLSYLVHGYVNQEIQDDIIYDNIPDDIIISCIRFGYDSNINRLDIRDKWYSDIVPSNAMIFGMFSITTKTIRKLWRLKIVSMNNQLLTLKIGIGSDECENQLFIKNGFIHGTEIKITNNDIISILFLKTMNNTLRFAINGKECAKKNNYGDGTGWFWAVNRSNQQIHLHLLNDTFVKQK
eukprot:28722_1